MQGREKRFGEEEEAVEERWRGMWLVARRMRESEGRTRTHSRGQGFVIEFHGVDLENMSKELESALVFR